GFYHRQHRLNTSLLDGGICASAHSTRQKDITVPKCIQHAAVPVLRGGVEPVSRGRMVRFMLFVICFGGKMGMAHLFPLLFPLNHTVFYCDHPVVGCPAKV